MHTIYFIYKHESNYHNTVCILDPQVQMQISADRIQCTYRLLLHGALYSQTNMQIHFFFFFFSEHFYALMKAAPDWRSENPRDYSEESRGTPINKA